MKKRILGLLLACVLLLGMLPITAGAANAVSFADTYANIGVTVTMDTGTAAIASYSYDAGTNTLSLAVSGVTDNKVTLTATATALRFYQSTSTVNVSSGSGSATFRIFGQNPQQGESITVKLTVVSGLRFTTDLSGAEVTCAQGEAAAALTVAAVAEDGGEVSYQWYANGTAIEGMTSATYTPATDVPGTTRYHVVAAAGGKTVTSKTATITVLAPAVTFTKDLSEEEVTVRQGYAAPTLTVAASHNFGAAVSYQWYADGTAIEGATSASYTPASDVPGTTSYYAVATADGLSVTSKTAKITVIQHVNSAPALAGEAEGAGAVVCALPYTMDLGALFTDADGDAMTYRYAVNGGEAVATPAAFTYTPAETGTNTVVFTAVDDKDAVSPAYTLTLTVLENPAPTLTGAAEQTAAVSQFETWSLDLAPLFADNDGDSLRYTVSIDGAAAVAASAAYSLTPNTSGEKTLVFYAVDKAGNQSPAYTVKLTVIAVTQTTIATGCVKKAGNFDGWLGSVTITGVSVIDSKWRGGSGHDETKDASHELYVQLDPATADDAVMAMGYALAGTTGQVKYKSTPPASVTLSGGTAKVSVTTTYSRMASWVTTRNYTLHFTNKANTAPVASSAQSRFEAFVSEDYTVDLTSVFTDAENHPMTYTVSVNGGEATEVDSTYTETLLTAGTHTYVFTATDIWGASARHAVTVTAKIDENSYKVTVNVPEGVAPTFYYTADAAQGTELSARGEENVYTVTVPSNISVLAWRYDGMGMHTNVSPQQNTLTLYKTDYVVMAGEEVDAGGVVSVKYGSSYASGKNNSFLLLSTGSYTVSTTVSAANSAKWRNSELTGQAAAQGAVELPLEYRGVGFTVPDFASVYVCTANERQGKATKELGADKTVDNGDGTKTVYYVLNNGTHYEYRVFVPETEEGSLQYVPFVGLFKKAETSAYTVTAQQLEDGENGRKTIDHVITPYTSEETLDMANVADLYMNVNAKGYLQMTKGQTKDLYTARAWWATNCGGWAMNTYYYLEPDYTYCVVDLFGNPSSDVVTVDSKGKLRAVGDGTAIVLVTYDAMNVDIDEQLYKDAGPERPLSDGFFSAIWPENTGVFVVSVGQGDSGIVTGMTINENKSTKNKAAGKSVDAEHDVIYFLGDKGEYTFTPGTEGVTVSVANPVITENVLRFTGFEEVAANADGSVTVPLTYGRNVVKVEKDGKAEYQVITAKTVNVTVNGKPLEEAYVNPGDEVTVVFDTLYNPVNRFGMYNSGAAVVYGDVSGYPDRTAGNYRGGMGFYFFASHAPHQTVANFNKDSVDDSGYNNNSVELKETLTVPAEFQETHFTLSDGAFSVGGFSKFNFGDHREYMGQAPSSSGMAENIIAYFGHLPDIAIPSAKLDSIEVTSQPVKTAYAIGEAFDPAGMAVTGNYSNTAGSFSQSVTDFTWENVTFTEAGTQTVTVICGDKTATVSVMVTAVKRAELAATGDLALTFAVEKSKVFGDGNYAVITHSYADGRDDVSQTIAQSAWTAEETCYTFDYDDYAAKEMTDAITVTVYDAAGAVISQWTEYVCDIVTQGMETADTQHKALLEATLEYGAAAQIYFDYGTENLANKGLDAAQSALAAIRSQLEGVRSDKSLIKGSAANVIYGASCILGSKLQMKVYFTDNDMRVFVGDTEVQLQASVTEGYYYCTIDVAAEDIFDTLTISVKGENTAATLTDSVAGYCARLYKQGGEKNAALADAILTYGLAAKAAKS